MARGWEPVKERAQAAAEAQKRFAESAVPMLFSKEIRRGRPDGTALIVRFLEQGPEVYSYERHPIKKPGQQYADLYTCLSEIQEDCPACRAGLKSTRKGAYNLIIRDRAVYRKGADGKAVKTASGDYIIDGYADQLVVWECSNTTANVIGRADGDFRGLMSRDMRLSCTGEDKNPYAVAPVDIDGGAQPMSDEDMVIAAGKHDLDKVFAPPTRAEMASLVAKYGANSGSPGPVAAMPSTAAAAPPNPFLAGASLPPSAFAAAQDPVKR